MRKIALLAVAIATAASFSGVSQAGEPVDGPSGFLCGFSSISNPTAEASTQTGEIDGGPLVIVDEAGNVGSGTLTCTIQVNQSTHAGSGVSVSAHGTGVVTIPPTVVSYQAGDDDLVYLCTEFTYDGGPTLYYHSSNVAGVSGHWSLDISSECSLATSAGTGEITDPLNPVLCPVLAVLLPPEGDLPGVWDCP